MNETWLSYIREKFTDTPFFRFMGVDIDTLEKGFARLSLEIKPDLLNTYGACHGGALAALVDMSMGIGLRTLMVKVVTVELSMNYLQPAYPGEKIVAEAKAIYEGRRVIVAEANLIGREGLIAKGKGTFLVTGPDSIEESSD